MEVRQSSDNNTRQPAEEGVEPSCRAGAGAVPCGLIQLEKSDGTLTGHQDINKNTCGMLRSYKKRRKQKKDNEPDSLSDIDDTEVFGYLNTKEEIQYKRLLWEAMNQNYTKAKKQKRTTETKKSVNAKKAAKTAKKVESQRPKSRINYDALRILNDELEKGSETAQIIGADPYTHRTENSPDGNISDGSNEGSYNEDPHHIHSYKDNGTSGHDDDEMYYEYRDVQANDEYFDF